MNPAEAKAEGLTGSLCVTPTTASDSFGAVDSFYDAIRRHHGRRRVHGGKLKTSSGEQMPFPIYRNGKILFRNGLPAFSTECCCNAICDYPDMIFLSFGLEGIPVDESVVEDVDFDPVEVDGFEIRYVRRQRNNPSPNGFFCVYYTYLYDLCLTSTEGNENPYDAFTLQGDCTGNHALKTTFSM
ncbi:hypothetical protein [Rhodopirellula bahusiensis]|uniref:hypothetical protein n=1 Tax=Rhodopirellula bahusiensis TaxID=2014065 RepID=UPI0032667292